MTVVTLVIVVIVIAVITVGLLQQVFLCSLAIHLNETPEFPWNWRLYTINGFVLYVFEVHNFYLRLQPFQEINQKIDEHHSAKECFISMFVTTFKLDSDSTFVMAEVC